MNLEPEGHRARKRDAGGRIPGGDADAADAGEPLDGVDEVLELESLLRRMPLRRPEAALDGRVLTACRRPVVRRRFRWVAAAALVAAAGSAPIVKHLLTRDDVPANTSVRASDPSTRPPPVPMPLHTPPTMGQAQPRPVRIERTLAVGFSSDGVVGVAGDAPLHRYRRLSVRQVWIVDPKTGKRAALTIPREEVVVVRVEPF